MFKVRLRRAFFIKSIIQNIVQVSQFFFIQPSFAAARLSPQTLRRFLSI